MEESNIHAGTGITEVWARRSITSVNREVVVEQARSNYRVEAKRSITSVIREVCDRVSKINLPRLREAFGDSK